VESVRKEGNAEREKTVLHRQLIRREMEERQRERCNSGIERSY